MRGHPRPFRAYQRRFGSFRLSSPQNDHKAAFYCPRLGSLGDLSISNGLRLARVTMAAKAAKKKAVKTAPKKTVKKATKKKATKKK